MKALGGLSAHVAQEVTTLATCWKLTRTDGQVFGFTDHDQDIVVAGLTYRAAIGYRASTIASSANLAVDNLDVDALIDSLTITHADILSGRWDHAAVEIFKVNWADPAAGQIAQKSGRIGEVEIRGQTYRAELRGLTQALQQTIGELYSTTCRATLGDARCKQVLTDYTASATVTAAATRARLTTDLATATVRLTPSTTGAPPDAYFAGGLLTWLTGANAGRQIETVAYTAATQLLELALPAPFAVAVGDTFTVRAGCAKTLAACRDRFGNLLNRRAEDYVPGIDRVLRPGGA